MASTAAYGGHTRTALNETDTTLSDPLRASSRRISSFSSLPSLSSDSSLRSSSFSFHDASPFSPSSPLPFSGIPFSWEKLPGIPKQQIPKKKSPSLNLLPLPPIPSKKSNPEQTTPIRKANTSESFRKDPFFTALIECSKDDDDTIGRFWKSSKVTRAIIDPFWFIGMHTSCKRTCAVSESIVYLPRSSTNDLLNRRSS